MLFPEFGAEYYDEKHKDIISRMQKCYADSITINQSYWGEADVDLRFFSGDQTVFNDLYGNLPANRRRQFTFNHIRPIINLISGYQRRNRKSTIVTGVENADDVTADQLTKVLMWVHNQEGVLETISQAFEGSLVTGMNLLQVWVDYRSDPISGNIRVDNCPYNSFLIDPFFRKSDLSDCNYVWKRSFLSKRACISLLPEKKDELINLTGNDSRNDGKFQFLPESYNWGRANLLTYDEFYYRDYRTSKMLVDTRTGETQEWRMGPDENLKLFLQMYPEITMIEQEVPTVRVAIVVQGKVMYDGPNPLGIDAYPFVPVLSYYNPQMPYYPYRVQGVVRGLRDAQYLYNRRKIIELDILESQINSGWIFKENALVNPKDVFLSGQGKGLALKKDAQMTDVQQILPPQIPPSTIELSNILAAEITKLSGANEELLGQAMDDKAGILSMLRQGAGLTTLQSLFDNLDYAQKLLGRLMLDIIQVNFTPGKVQKILGGEQPAPQFYNKAFGKYNAVVEEGFNTATQKQMEFAQLLQLRELGVPIPNEVLIQTATLQNKDDLIKAIEQQQQSVAQQQMQASQMQLAKLQADTKLVEARTIADTGLGAERYSRIAENKALAQERKAAAVKDEELGFLNMVKAVKELETMDLEQVERLITLVKAMHQKQEQPSQPEGVLRETPISS